MTAFDDKENAAENKYAHDREMAFKVHARTHKLLGLWAAAKMGLLGAAAEEYALSLIMADMSKANPEHLFERVRTDLLAHEVHISDHDIKAEIYRFEMLAKEQLVSV